MARKRRRFPSRAKAKTILKDGSVRGHKLTKRQRGFFGLLAGGGKPRKGRRRRSGRR